jgi:hypothetical protein
MYNEDDGWFPNAGLNLVPKVRRISAQYPFHLNNCASSYVGTYSAFASLDVSVASGFETSTVHFRVEFVALTRNWRARVHTFSSVYSLYSVILSTSVWTIEEDIDVPKVR